MSDNPTKPRKQLIAALDAMHLAFTIPGKPGVYRAVAFLKPHYQLEELAMSLRLVAELPPPAK